MDLVRQFFSATINPYAWLESLATFLAITLLAAAVFVIGWVRMFQSRSQAFDLLAGGLIITIMNVAGQIGWFRHTPVAAGRAWGLWFCAISICVGAAFLLIAGRRLGRRGETSLGRFMIHTSLLFLFQAAVMGMQGWNDQTLADYAACLEGTACDVRSASDGLVMMPLWILPIIGVLTLLDGAWHLIKAHRAKKAASA